MDGPHPVGGRIEVPPAAEPAFALSVDVEDYFQVQAFARYVRRDEWTRFPPRVEANTQRLLDLFDEHRARGTFFVLGWVARRHARLVHAIVRRGHEIASHGMDHRMLTSLTPEEFRQQALESRTLLEDICQRRVLGFRAPSYSVGRKTLWAIDVLAETGYEYDSSIYPIRGRRYGYPGGATRPTRLFATGRTLAEFPLPTLPFGPLRLPVLAGAYLRLLPSSFSMHALRFHAKRNIPLVLNVHPWEIDPGQPTIGPFRLRTWAHYARLEKTEAILGRLLGAARFRDIASRLRGLGLLSPEDENEGSVPRSQPPPLDEPPASEQRGVPGTAP